MDSATRALVRERAAFRCEYCRLHQDDSPLAALHVEHVRPKKHGGTESVSNLALACISCNLHKGSNLTGVDPGSGKVTVLFDPRTDDWDAHFRWHGIRIAGRTAVGRTTILVLDMNSAEQLAVRSMTRP